MKIEPFNGQVLIKPLKQRKTKSGIILPEIAQERAQIGEVIKASEIFTKDAKIINLAYNFPKGTKVIYRKWGQNPIKDPETKEDYLLIPWTDILAILK